MRRVILESPYGSPDDAIVARNVRYARACVRDCVLRGDAPIASHLLFTQEGILDDRNPEERKLGIEAGLAWGVEAKVTVAYMDLGTSKGMKLGIERAEAEGRRVEYHELGGEWALQPAYDTGKVINLAPISVNITKRHLAAAAEWDTGGARNAESAAYAAGLAAGEFTVLVVATTALIKRGYSDAAEHLTTILDRLAAER